MVLAVLYPVGKAKKPDVLNAEYVLLHRRAYFLLIYQYLLLSVVAVHGPNGGMKRTWIHEETKKFWLQNFFPINVPNGFWIHGWCSIRQLDCGHHGLC